jgi:hypothetical protein
MKEVKRALAEIHSIRHQVARGTQFRGYGPASIAFSGFLALVVAWAQVEWGGWVRNDVTANLVIWISVATVSMGVSGFETFSRARRVHAGLTQEMLQSAVEQIVPALVIGVLFTAVLLRFAPGDWEFSPHVVFFQSNCSRSAYGI